MTDDKGYWVRLTDPRGPSIEPNFSVTPCARCGMIVHPACPDPHVCPEPWPYDVALSFVQLHSSPGAPPVHPRDYAAAKLGLERRTAARP